MFLCVIDVSKEKNEVVKELHFYLSFIDHRCGTAASRSKVVIVGSHADVAMQSPEKYEKVCKTMKSVSKERYGDSLFAVVGLDCRQLSSDGLDQLVEK